MKRTAFRFRARRRTPSRRRQTARETSIELSFRHTYYSGRAGQFEITEQLPSDRYAEDGFYGRDLRVTRYSYTVTAPSDGNYYTFCFIYDCNPRKTQVICESGVTGTANGMGVAYAYLSAGETREVTFYAVGEQLTSADIRTKLSVGRGSSSGEASGGSISILTETRQTFAEFVEDFRPSEQTEYGGVSELDWYNAVVAMLLSGESGMLFLSDDLPLLDYLLLWGEYSITIPAGKHRRQPRFGTALSGHRGRQLYLRLSALSGVVLGRIRQSHHSHRDPVLPLG